MAIGEISSNHLYTSQQNTDTTNAYQQQVEQDRATAAGVNKPVESTNQQNAGLQSSSQNTTQEKENITRTQSNTKPDDSEKVSISANANIELSEEEMREVRALNIRDREVRSHEAAHSAAAGAYAQGGPTYTFQRGPDGKSYATGGEVKIDTSAIPGDPEATVRKAQQIKASALAPAEPSPQDRSVAASATQLIAAARQASATERLDAINETRDEATTQSNAENKESQPASNTYAEVARFKDSPEANTVTNNIDLVI